MAIRPVLFNEVLDEWHWVEPLLAKAVDRMDSGMSIEDILTRIQTRHMQLWVVPEEMAAVTTIQNHPQFRVCIIAYMGGEGMKEWLGEFLEVVGDWASQNGCKYLEGWGRPGWEKATKEFGFEKALTVMRKTL